MKKRSTYYTVMIIPDDNKRPVSMRLHHGMFRIILIVIILFCAGISVLVGWGARISAKLQLVHTLKTENSSLRRENESLRSSFLSTNHSEHMTRYLQRLSRMVEGTPYSVSSELSQTTTHANTTLQDSSKTAPAPAHGFSSPGPVVPDTDYATSLLGLPNIRPVEGWITKHFSVSLGDDTESEEHLGVDFAAAEGTPIRATAPGVVQKIWTDRYFGKMVVVDHAEGFSTRYGHCSQILVAGGDHVKRGQTIALVGNTGMSTAPHLHYEVLKEGKPVDPLKYFYFHRS